MKFISKPLSILESTMFIDEIVSWAFGEDGVYNPFRYKLGKYMAILHYCVEDIDTENMGLTELFEYIYTENNSDKIMQFVLENAQIRDLVDAAGERINIALVSAQRKTKFDELVEKIEDYVDEHPELLAGITEVNNDGSEAEKAKSKPKE